MEPQMAQNSSKNDEKQPILVVWHAYTVDDMSRIVAPPVETHREVIWVDPQIIETVKLRD